MTAELIRVAYAELDEMAKQFGFSAQTMSKLIDVVGRTQADLVNGGWTGAGAAAFRAEMEDDVLPGLLRLAAALQEGDVFVRACILVYGNAEAEAAAHFGQDAFVSGGGGGGGGGGGSAGGGGFDEKKFWRDVIPDGSEYLLKAIGKFGKYGKWFDKAGDVGGFGLGLLLDEDLATNPVKAIAGEGAAFGVKLIPGVGQVVIVSDVIQLGGNVVAGSLYYFGYEDTATWIQDNLDYIDLSGYAEQYGEDVYDVISRWAADPSKIFPDIKTVSESISPFESLFFGPAYPFLKAPSVILN